MADSPTFAEVIIDINTDKLDRVFHYAIPPELKDEISLGSRVTVPFGNRKEIEGYVVGITGSSPVSGIKEIKQLLDIDPVINPDLLTLARWLAENYLCTLVEALQAVLPAGIKSSLKKQVKPKKITLVQAAAAGIDLEKALSTLTPKQAVVLRIVSEAGSLPIGEAAARSGVTPGVIRNLVNKGCLLQIMGEVKRDPYAGQTFESTLPLEPTPEQAMALERILKAINRGSRETFLLHGVTGSGKTEIYLQSIAQALELGKQAIVLVPEISLTPQMVERFKGRFGHKVAVLHSALSTGERYDEWRKIKDGEVEIVVGARSAVFAPFDNTGLIIIDEEHEVTYKQEDDPKYHAREAALMRAEINDAVVILGSATPAVETYHRALEGEFKLINLLERVDNRPLPEVSIVDLKEELKAGNKSIFSRELVEKIQIRLDRKEQVILFLNRRGFSTFVMCRECSLVMNCPHCDVSLTYHSDNRLRCHYCRHEESSPSTCPKCGSKYIRYFGVGTQKVEEEIKRYFPEVAVLRMDMDTTGRKGSHQRILDSFKKGEASILVGTQMIAKGLDFPRVTLVGVITADTALNLPDFRSGERTFQLLTQVAGRAGRGNIHGEVVIQTYSPDHYSIKAAQEHNYSVFYPQEMIYREEAGYPPFTGLIKIVTGGFQEDKVIRGAMALGQRINQVVDEEGLGSEIEILGPAPAAWGRIKNKFRWQVVLKGKDLNQLRGLIKLIMEKRYEESWGDLMVSIDVEPQGLI